MIELVAFLGNPGREYSRNRHNAGYLLADRLSFSGELSWQKKYRGLYAAIDKSRLTKTPPDNPQENARPTGLSAMFSSMLSGTFSAQGSARFHFIKPQTFMNLSGRSVSEAASFFKIKTDAILIVHDELELPPGTLSLKFGGGLGGHNGLRSLNACFGNADFWRLRIGIGRPDSRQPGEGGPKGSGKGIADWVLSDFEDSELETLNKTLESGAELLIRVLVGGPESLLPEWAKKKIE
jgi:PTH1 family peptidyl-tRNA hydrolase